MKVEVLKGRTTNAELLLIEPPRSVLKDLAVGTSGRWGISPHILWFVIVDMLGIHDRHCQQLTIANVVFHAETPP
jgi:hypothetical protein